MLKIYNQYQTHGVKDYYQQFSNKYFNPHQDRIKTIYIKYIKDMISRNTTILDIACGDGLISRLVDHYNQNHNVDGTDPYFTNQYTKFNFSFEDIALGKLNNCKYDLVICCYAFHLIDKTWKYDFLTELASITTTFVIITPSKKITIDHPLWTVIEEIRDDKITVIKLFC
jgi:2-polyprenyl-3-methyl-5-hydroxy-6-metoxy-1,4-benzoquinol methylase